MNWIESLYQTYDNCFSRIGIPEEGVNDLLLPLSHTTQNANIEVTLDEDGNFLRAKVIPKKTQKTLYPALRDPAEGQVPSRLHIRSAISSNILRETF